MTSIYQTKVRVTQIPFVVLWFAILMAVNILIPHQLKFIKALLLLSWWSVLAYGIHYFESKKERASNTPKIEQIYVYPMNEELYKKAIEHNREQQVIFIRLWLAGLLIVIVGIYFKMHQFKTAAFLITTGLFLTSFLSKSLLQNNRSTRA